MNHETPSPSSIPRKLEAARKELLDLSARNRLLNTPRRRQRSSSLEIEDERSEHVFRLLVAEGRAMSFLPAPEPDQEPETAPDAPAVDLGAGDVPLANLPQPDGDGPGETDETDPEGVAPRHTDDRLQTGLPTAALQRKLLRTYYAARTYQEEQGVNILFLALGFLKWYEPEKPEQPRYAPLLLVPVELERPSARSKFRISFTGEDIGTNLSLQVKLRAEFGLELPDVPEDHDEDDLSPGAYFDAVEAAIAGMPGWSVERDDIVLWFFSFAKLLMYRDLDPERWPEDRPLADHGLVRSVLEGGFTDEPPLCGEDDSIDGLIDPARAIHVMDADSSQALAIEEVRRGRSLVIQGPPGTGKSQTIANIIAAAVHDGQRVLFVAEKVAALNVVKDRLESIGLGDMCLAVHSNRARKRQVIEELGRTLGLEPPVVEDAGRKVAELAQTRDELNRHATSMHRVHDPSGLTPYRVLGELVRLRAAGVPLAEFVPDDAETWTAAQLDAVRRQVGELAAHVEEIGVPAAHPWRGVRLEAVMPMDVDRLAGSLPDSIAAAETAIGAAEHLAGVLTVEAPLAPAEALGLAAFGRRLSEAPNALDRSSLADPAWEHHRADIARLVEAGRTFASSRQALDGVLVEAGWSFDAGATRRALAAHGRSLLRFLSGSYRRARADLRGILAVAPPAPLDERLEILDALIEGRRARGVVEDARDLGQRAFGAAWRGEDSDWDALAAIEAWEAETAGAAGTPAAFRSLAAAIADPGTAAEAAAAVERDADSYLQRTGALLESVDLDLADAFDGALPGSGAADAPGPEHLPFTAVLERLGEWRAHPESISRWIAYRRQRGVVVGSGLAGLASRLHEGRIAPADADAALEMAYHETLMRRMIEEDPALASFDGLAHERVLARFQALDRQRIGLARREVALAHHGGIPRGGAGIGELGVVKREIAKRRRHLPLRKLLRTAGNAVAAIKPVFMMSPLSVAQYLEPGSLRFDLLVIDEASQVRPVDALGAAARADRIVVVGDDKQLPPTSFFNKILDAEEADASEIDELQVGDLESILGLCAAQSLPQRLLRWHYRSRHHSLIATSNREFYDGRLHVIPSPGDDGGALGLVFRHVPEGVFDRGGSATNQIEARAVARAVMEHARLTPDVTLGVGTFSIRQRDAILDILEALRREEPGLEAFFAPGRSEPFFVKNLENIQGDERDVILISVGYGRDATGFVSMNFGPLSAEGGERRLNVLITRARRRCTVFSSMTAEDIDLARASGRGPAAFRAFLADARSGPADGADGTARDAVSPFETSIAETLRGRGLEVEGRVGIAGLYVDLAVRDRATRDRYLLGIQCDGASYHAARSARDRDRIRPQVLEDRGWALHRIWSSDWFNRPEEQLEKLLEAIDSAEAETAAERELAGADELPADPADDPADGPTDDEHDGADRDGPGGIERADATTEHDDDPMSVPYEEAALDVPSHTPIHELSPAAVAGVVARIVAVEGPVHADEVAHRVRTLWGQSRAGSRIQEAVRTGIEEAERRGTIARDGAFCDDPARTAPVTIRDRSRVRSTSLRTPAMIPPREIAAGVAELVRRHLGVTRDEAIVSTARLLGFRATSARLREVIGDVIDAKVAEGQIEERDGRLQLPG